MDSQNSINFSERNKAICIGDGSIELVAIQCPICGSGDKRIIGKPRRADKVFSSLASFDLSAVDIVACKRCNLVYPDPFPRLSKTLLEKMYSTENSYFPQLIPRMERVIHFWNPLRRFRTAQHFSKREISNYLEIGCGLGYGLEIAQSFNWNIFGQDISPDFATIVKKRTGIDIKVGTIDASSYPYDFFDFIYIDSVLEHVPNPIEYMQYIASFLAPEGIIYLTLPNVNSLPNVLFDCLLKLGGKNQTSRIMPFCGPYHFMGFSNKSVHYMANALNLTIPYLIRHYTHRDIEVDDRPFSITRFVRRHIFGLFHCLCDAIEQGMNMEVIFIKKK